MQKAFVLDINKCTGCQACEVACAVENQLTPGTSWRSVDTFNAPRHPGIPLFHLSLACNHCVDPPCMEHCPALAYSKNDDTGAVTIDAAACIGCKYCTWACPYDAPRFDASQGVVAKCTFCNHRLAEGKRPACVSECPTGALQIADLDTAPGVANAPGMPRVDVGAAVRFIPLRGERPYPEVAGDERPIAAVDASQPASKVSLRSEWPLVVFTLLAATLVGAIAAGTTMNPLVFIALAGAGMALSTLHLGRKARAWRAILNWRRSWLSREIISFSAFAGLATARLFAGGGSALTWPAAVVGFAALFAMDRVYEVTRTPGLRLHSAQVVLTGVLVFSLTGGFGPAFLAVLIVKLILYVYRKIAWPRPGASAAVLGALRVVPGALVPMWMWGTGDAGTAVVLGIALGEIIDRCEFYLELDVPTPRGQIARDLEAAVFRTHFR